MNDFYRIYPFDGQIREPGYSFVGSHANRLLYYDILESLPINVGYHISGIPYIGSSKI